MYIQNNKPYSPYFGIKYDSIMSTIINSATQSRYENTPLGKVLNEKFPKSKVKITLSSIFGINPKIYISLGIKQLRDKTRLLTPTPNNTRLQIPLNRRMPFYSIPEALEHFFKSKAGLEELQRVKKEREQIRICNGLVDHSKDIEAWNTKIILDPEK